MYSLCTFDSGVQWSRSKYESFWIVAQKQDDCRYIARDLAQFWHQTYVFRSLTELVLYFLITVTFSLI